MDIEIPFGAKDSELIKFEYTIPEGYEAEIKDGKVIVRKVDSEDERIKKAITEFFNLTPQKVMDIAIAKCFEQGEQKSTDKIEPKFKVGDWVVRGKTIAQILDIQKQYYVGIDTNGNDFTSSRFLSDDKIHLWTIQDAKDGDVLANDHHILILKELVYDWSSNGTPNSVKAYCGIKPNGNLEIGKDNWCFCGILHIHPATKEQRDFLFQKMKEASYEWDAEKKELKKVEYEIEIPFGVKDSELQEVTYYIPKGFHAEIDDDKVVIKKGEKPTKWSEEDETMLENIIKHFIRQLDNSQSTSPVFKDFSEKIDWLKSLKDKVQPQNSAYYNPYKEVVESIAEMCEKYKLPTSNLSDFLDNVKVKCKEAKEYDSIFPQKQWKPSKRQIRSLEYTIRKDKGNVELKDLESLYEQLKAL